MKKFNYCLMILAIIMSSCAPKMGGIIVLKSYPELPPESQVTEYINKSEVPVNSEVLGVVSVTNKGKAKNGSYKAIAELIREEVRKIGGNAFLITEHINPNNPASLSACHQLTVIAINVFDQDHDIRHTAQLEDIKLIEKKRTHQKIKISADIGRSSQITNLNKTVSDDKKSKDLGFLGDVKTVSFGYYFENNFGVGLSCVSLESNSKGKEIYEADERSSSLFIGPEFLIQRPFHRNWQINMDIGIGYVNLQKDRDFKDTCYKYRGNTMGFQTKLGVEYKPFRNFGIAFNVSSMAILSGNMKCIQSDWLPDNYERFSSPSEGYMNLQLGLRYYIQ